MKRGKIWKAIAGVVLATAAHSVAVQNLRAEEAHVSDYVTEYSAAQPPVTPQPPLIPETEVEATSPATASAGDEFFGPSILNGTIFDSPPAFGYRAESSTTGTIINVPDIDLPATVNVVPRAVIDDQIILNFDEIVRNVPGVITGGSQNSIFADSIFLRGLEVTPRNFRKDGFLDPTLVPRDFQNVERIEILKGPASVLYGAGDPAGVVNVITKKPVDDQFADFGFTFGGFETARYTLDLNGHGSTDGNVLYRLNVAQEDSESFRDFGFIRRTQIAPSVTWMIDDRTVLTWVGEWHRDHRRGDQGVPAVFGDPLFLPPDRYVGEPANDFLHTEEFRQSLVLRHEISDAWWLSVGGSSLFYDYPNSTTAASGNFGFLPAAPEPFFYRQRSNFTRADEQSQSAIANLAGEFWTGNVLHKALAGIEYNYFDSDTHLDVNALPPINTANPIYTNPPPIFPVPLFSFDAPTFRQQRVGGYLQDLVEINPYLKALAGVRWDSVDFTFDRTITVFGVPNPTLMTDQTFTRTSPRAGLVLQPFADESLSLYYSYAQSFNPPSGGVYFDLAPLLPILGESHEAGVKAELLPGLSLTACGYQITRENDTFNLGLGVLTQVGEVRSQGAEVSLVGDITDQLSVIANYAYTDARIFDPDPLLNNNFVRDVPFNAANLWTRYDFIQNECQTVGAAVGLVYQDDRPANLTNTLELPGFIRWDAGAYYCRGPFRANVYLENLFDKHYAASSIDEFQIFPGAPFNVRASLSYLF